MFPVRSPLSRPLVPIGVALVIALALLAGARVVVAAPGDCVLRAAVDPAPDDEGSTSLAVEPDVEITFWGSFVPDAQIDLTFTWNGAPYGDFTPGTADAEGDFLFVHSFPASQVGAWTVTAAVAGTECAGTVEIAVGEAGAASPSPSASMLPNTAVLFAEASPPAATAAAAILVAVLVAVAALRSPRRRRGSVGTETARSEHGSGR